MAKGKSNTGRSSVPNKSSRPSNRPVQGQKTHTQPTKGTGFDPADDVQNQDPTDVASVPTTDTDGSER